MNCKNHPAVAAVARCTGCAEPFCSACVVNIGGQPYCASCKVMAVQGAPMVETATLPNKEADDALKYAIIGIFCFGIILEPIALVKANKAAKMIDMNPRLQGSGKVKAARIIAITALVLWVIGIIYRVMELSKQPI